MTRWPRPAHCSHADPSLYTWQDLQGEATPLPWLKNVSLVPCGAWDSPSQLV